MSAKMRPHLIGLCVLLSPTVFGQEDYERIFKKISSALTASQSEDVSENLTIAGNLLKRKKLRLKTLLKGRDERFMQVLEALSSLEEIVTGNPDCIKTQAILERLNQNLGGQDYRVRSDQPEDRVESIVCRLSLEHSRRCPNVFKRISSALIETIQSDDINENLAEAQKLLESEKVKLKKMYLSRDEELVDVLELLLKLKAITSGDQNCIETGAILKTINEHLGGHVCRVRSDIPEDRFESIIYRLALEHSRRCRDFYRIQLREIDKKLDRVYATNAKQLVDLALKTHYRKTLDENDFRRLDLGSVENEIGKLFKEHRALELLINLKGMYSFADSLKSTSSYEGRKNLVIKAIDQSNGACGLTVFKYEPIMKILNFDQQVQPLAPLTEFPDEDEAQFRLAIMKYKICQEYLTSYRDLYNTIPIFVEGFE